MKNISKQQEEKVFTVNQIGSILERMDDSIQLLAEAQAEANIRLNGIDGRLDKVETKIDRLQDDMVEVKFDLKRKVDAEQFEKLEKRVVKLEKLSLSH